MEDHIADYEHLLGQYIDGSLLLAPKAVTIGLSLFLPCSEIVRWKSHVSGRWVRCRMMRLKSGTQTEEEASVTAPGGLTPTTAPRGGATERAGPTQRAARVPGGIFAYI